MAEYHYIEGCDLSYYTINCEACDKKTDISEDQMQYCMDSGEGEICSECMWGGKEE